MSVLAPTCDQVAERIQQDLDHIVSEVAHLHGVTSLILMGAFGRGEGSVIAVNGEIQPLNDYDLMLVSESAEDLAEQVRILSTSLARELGMDFVDFDLVDPKRFVAAPPTIYYYDLKYGSRVLWGDPTVLDLLPDYRPEDIPLSEAIRLLLNRMAGILGGFLASRRGALGSQDYLYMRNQLVKAAVACGDALIVGQHRHHHLYRERRQRLGELRHSGALAFLQRDDLALIDEGYAEKLSPTNQLDRDLWGWLHDLLPAYEKVFVHLVEVYTNNDSVLNVSTAIEAYSRCHSRVSLRQRLHLPYRLARDRCWDRFYGVPHVQRAYAALPLVLFSCPVHDFDPDKLRLSREMLRSVARVRPGSDSLDWDLWEAHRSAALEAWEQLCH